MSFIDIFTWFVLLIMVATVVGVFVLMGIWPGKVAHERNHPQAKAIQIGSWAALIMGAVFWPVVLVWAYTRPPNIQVAGSATGEETDGLSQKIAALETRLAQLEARQGGAQ
jgi:hypothetical protein